MRESQVEFLRRKVGTAIPKKREPVPTKNNLLLSSELRRYPLRKEKLKTAESRRPYRVDYSFRKHPSLCLVHSLGPIE